MNAYHTHPLLYATRFQIGLLGLAVLIATAGLTRAHAAETVLHSFKGDGAHPVTSLVIDGSGALYGTTSNILGDFGQVFKLTPPAPSAKQWTKTVLYRFKGGSDGAEPSRLIFDESGALYGTTSVYDCFEDTCGVGTVFKLTPQPTGKKWAKTVLYRFKGSSGAAFLKDGGLPDPKVGLIRDNDGAFYGTTRYGGSKYGQGTVFKLTPSKASKSEWRKSILHRFKDEDGLYPGSLALDGSGSLYGTTQIGGPGASCGSVFRLSPSARDSTEWTKTVIHFFIRDEDGCAPAASSLAIDRNGALYGMTMSGNGAVFRLTPPTAPATTWSKATYILSGGEDGFRPSAGLILDREGVLYGTTRFGGNTDNGTVFKLIPPALMDPAWKHSVLHHFNGKDGAEPDASLAVDGSGTLYGTTYYGGRHQCSLAGGCGTVFEIK